MVTFDIFPDECENQLPSLVNIASHEYTEDSHTHTNVKLLTTFEDMFGDI